MSAMSDLVIFVEELLSEYSIKETIKMVEKEYNLTEIDAKGLVNSIVHTQEQVYGMWS